MELNPKITKVLNDLLAKKIIVDSQLTKYWTLMFWIESGLLPNITRPIEEELKLLNLNKLIRKTPNTTNPVSLVYPLFISTQEAVELDVKWSNKNVRAMIMERVDEYRNCFSKDGKGTRGLKSGVMGDRADIVKKLSKWFKETQFRYTWDDVITTAKVYVHSCQESNYKYLQSADYFVYKDGRSRLSSYIDEFKDKPVTEQSDIEIHNEFI